MNTVTDIMRSVRRGRLTAKLAKKKLEKIVESEEELEQLFEEIEDLEREAIIERDWREYIAECIPEE